ncbi:MAG TPA: S8 family serine peptidase [Phycisphaerae bacterium]|nr:S8 family serine peptidase [Phycisphaerae bacterium]
MTMRARWALYGLAGFFIVNYLAAARLVPAESCPAEYGTCAVTTAAVGSKPQATPEAESGKVHPALERLLDESQGLVKAWVFFRDKGIDSPEELAAAIEALAGEYPVRAVRRRGLRRTLPGLFDEHDLPLVPAYVDAVAATGARVHVTSRWVNAVSVVASRQQVVAIAGLPFVGKLQPVRRSRRIEPIVMGPFDGSGKDTRDDRGFYGYAEAQLTQINLIALHNAGYTGQGVVVGVLDTGFERTHEAFNYPDHVLNVLAEWDFVDDDPDTSYEPGDDPGQHAHGTLILGVLGAYKPNELVGAVYDAAFILAKTEDTTGEYPAEEDNYVAGLEFIEQNGGDMATSSLGYIDWYTQDDLDGQTAVTTIAVNIATANGLVCCTAAGNGYHDGNPNSSHLIAPSDAFQVFSCGAVDASGYIADFSSDGPTADGRVKPELLARGVETYTVWPYDTSGYASASGTSLSTPLVAGAVGSLLQAHPEWSVDHFRNQLFYTADYYLAHQTYDPQYVRGYGILDAYGASTFTDCVGDLDGDDDTDQADLGILLADWGCTGGGCAGDLDGDDDTDQTDLGVLLADWGCGS